MEKPARRRVGAIMVMVVLLSLVLVPAAAASSQASNANGAACVPYHIVRRGDTLMTIAWRYGVNANTLARVNNISNYNRVYVGQRLTIPCNYIYGDDNNADYVAEPEYNPVYDGAPVITVPQQPVPIPVGHPGNKGQLYVVQPGDTFEILAARFGTTVTALMQVNGIGNNSNLYPGLVIRILVVAPPAAPAPGDWTADYFNNRDLAGSPVLERSEASIDYNWGWGPPAANVCQTNFSVRWTRNLYLDAGTYRVTATVDDGVRVYVDGTLVLNQWQVQSTRTFQQDYAVGAGNHTIVVEYFQAEGGAEVHVSSQRIY